MEELQTTLYNVFLSVSTLIITLGGIYLTNYLKVKIQAVRTQENAKYLDNIERAISQVINAVSQTYVDSLKKDNAFTIEAQQQALDKAVQLTKEIAENRALELINELHGDIDTYLKIQIENQIKLAKGV